VFGDAATALTVLSAMITPAVLISACGTLTVSTATRLSRVIERTRRLGDELARTIAEAAEPADLIEERRQLLLGQLDRATRRSRLLQRALARLYWAICVLVGTTVAIGLVAASGQGYGFVPIGLGLAGAGLLFDASVALIRESRLAIGAIEDEMTFVWRVSQREAERRAA
jgi:hypothetical protein